jgi:hypothetical protein
MSVFLSFSEKKEKKNSVTLGAQFPVASHIPFSVFGIPFPVSRFRDLGFPIFRFRDSGMRFSVPGAFPLRFTLRLKSRHLPYRAGAMRVP